MLTRVLEQGFNMAEETFVLSPQKVPHRDVRSAITHLALSLEANCLTLLSLSFPISKKRWDCCMTDMSHVPGTCWVFGKRRVWIPFFAPFLMSYHRTPSSWQALSCWLQQPIIVSGSSWKEWGWEPGRGGDNLSDCRPTLKVSWGILAIATGAPITLP